MKTFSFSLRGWPSFLLFQLLGSIVCATLIVLMDFGGAFQKTFVASSGIPKAIAFFVAMWLAVSTISVIEYRGCLIAQVAFLFVALIASMFAWILAPFVPFHEFEMSFSGVAGLLGQIGVFALFCLLTGLLFLVVGKSLEHGLWRLYDSMGLS